MFNYISGTVFYLWSSVARLLVLSLSSDLYQLCGLWQCSDLTGPQFMHLENGDSNSTHSIVSGRIAFKVGEHIVSAR